MDAEQTRERFLVLVDQVCEELGFPPNEEVPHADHALAMEMDGISFSVVHDLEVSPERILIECRMGQLPEDNRLPALTRLLHFNRGFFEMGEAAFSIDAVNGDVMYTHACGLHDADGRSLLAIMTEMSWQARQWNSDYFIGEDTRASAVQEQMPLHVGSLA